MDDIPVYSVKGMVLKLAFEGAVHPAMVNRKADQWYIYYRLTLNGRKVTPHEFSDTFYLDRERNILVIVAFEDSIKDKEAIALASDVRTFLIALDINAMKYARFSTLHGGDYDNIRIEGDTILYEKRTGTAVQDTAVNLDDLKWEDAGPNGPGHGAL